MRTMELHINRKTSVQDLQDEFSVKYPYLKIDFFKPVKNITGWVIRMENLPGIDNIFSYLRTDSLNTLDINDSRTVTQVIREIEDSLTLTASIKRKSGGVWIATTLTTDWTLEHQNREGKYLSQ